MISIEILYWYIMIFIEAKAFAKAGQISLTEDELRALQERLLYDPTIGDLIPGTNGLRKLRIGHQARGKGK